MRKLFRSWRQKIGVAMLVMACALTGLWARSCIFIDYVVEARNGQYVVFTICNGVVAWGFRPLQYPQPNMSEHGIVEWGCAEPDINTINYWSGRHDFTINQWRWTIPFRNMPAPLAILSAVLILWPRRERARSDKHRHCCSQEESDEVAQLHLEFARIQQEYEFREGM